MLLGEGVF